MISVCIATYNGRKFIEEQIKSIIPQLSQDDEIIISDDNSTDKTIQEIRNINDKRIKIFFNNGKKGYTSNFENALKQASGQIIFLSDHDDIWCDNKVSEMLQILKVSDFVVSDCYVVDQNKEILADLYFELRQPYKSLIGNIFKFGYLGCCFAFRKEILKKVLPFPQQHNLCTHDNWIFLIAKTYYKTSITNKRLIKYRRHDANTSNGGIKSDTTILFKIKYRLYLLANIYLRLFK